MEEGYFKNEICNREGCEGIIEEPDKEGCCSCHINPPCSYCEDSTAYCPTCDWSAREEKREHIQTHYDKINRDHWDRQLKEWEEAKEHFFKMWRNEIKADKLYIRHEIHTNFSMIYKGVFPKGTETVSSLLPKIRGTFGGRFSRIWDDSSDKENDIFEYIAYTD